MWHDPNVNLVVDGHATKYSSLDIKQCTVMYILENILKGILILTNPLHYSYYVI